RHNDESAHSVDDEEHEMNIIITKTDSTTYEHISFGCYGRCSVLPTLTNMARAHLGIHGCAGQLSTQNQSTDGDGNGDEESGCNYHLARPILFAKESLQEDCEKTTKLSRKQYELNK
uniref:Uncharacterized protein n=1 Tax=Pristionchus pacificus TaxID=54126 RepID=A0A8R1UV80_PRIPA